MKILVVGNGGREHALVWKIRQSPLVTNLYCAPGNAGIAKIADCVPIDATNIVEVADFAQAIQADLTVVGPELPSVLGIADEFQRRDLTIFAPTRVAAELEGSKVYAREFMTRHNIPAPQYLICHSAEEAERAIDENRFGLPLVVKADGLAAGKGAVIASTAEEAKATISSMMTDRVLGGAGARIVLEEFLDGEEASFLVLSDGARVVPLVSAQDHKRAYDDDQGPNTGGMGAVSPATNLSMDAHKRVMHEVILPSIAGMAADGRPFRGVLYAGLMLTENGPKVLEFNVRFGDPEAQAILARMRSDLVPLLLGCARGNLGDARAEWAKEPSACVVLASHGYPDKPDTGQAVTGLDRIDESDSLLVFHAATAQRDGRTVTVGGRVLGVTALGETLEQALQRAYGAIDKITFDGMQFRKDIGKRALARLRTTA